MAPDDRNFSRAQVNHILRKAAEIDAELGDREDEDGLTESELLHVAEEAGIDRKVMLRALREYDLPGREGRFDWLHGTTSLQKKAVLEGEMTDGRWEELVRDIREITGGIGKVHTVGQVYEWEQRKRNTGYIHLSATPREGRTVLQFVSDWNTHRTSVNVISFTVFFVLAAMAMDAVPVAKHLQLLAGGVAGLAGIGVGRFFLRSFYTSQKERMQEIFKAFARRLRSDDPAADKARVDLDESGGSTHGPSRTRS
ncbi:MAG: hypothetical protein U5K31_11670 [Balneolaceae bacterium]|nr:hypothetical protein [Balneolaceae bacterium]